MAPVLWDKTNFSLLTNKQAQQFFLNEEGDEINYAAIWQFILRTAPLKAEEIISLAQNFGYLAAGPVIKS